MKSIVLAMVVLCGLFSSAEARRLRAYAVHPECNVTMPCEGVHTSQRGERVVRAMGGFGVATKTYTPRRVERAQRVQRVRTVVRHQRANRTLVASVQPSMTLNTTITHSPGVGPRPGRWCGWYMQHETGVTSAATRLNLNLAREWRHVGSPTVPGIGAIVVWAHHVGKIVGQAANGQWIVRSGNDGNRVRERPRSVAGAIAFRSL